MVTRADSSGCPGCSQGLDVAYRGGTARRAKRVRLRRKRPKTLANSRRRHTLNVRTALGFASHTPKSSPARRSTERSTPLGGAIAIVALDVPFVMLGLLQPAFSTKALRNVCEHASKAEAMYGPAVAATLRARLADLVAAETISDVIAGSPAEVPEEPGAMSVNLGEGLRLVFRSNHNRTPEKAGRVDWTRVTRIQLLRIESVR